ncbi:centromere-associated protein E-like isoform X3 [Sinocyclocheilus rhinocerous]|uniref:centromere-associated protein E-like isoform X3 n=1 Tax=Sinocyclocheilus rhinocerous TaxID=307959 RepID=UPI0007B9D3D4|nr:PREDICTED: centromere-associated protein E-like isoform X3 [Sinocyclocheilus rhinocerous]
MAEESAVKVCVRVRPLIKREESESSEPVQLYWRADKQAIHQLDDDGAQTKSFSFDRVFSAGETTTQLYQDIAKPLVVSAVEGYNGTIFAYGQTSSGKTFTMMGSERNAGVIPLAMADVFKTIKNCPKKEFLLRVSYMEIYNETVTDLLCESWKRKPLEIREGNYKNVYVADLTEELVTSPEQALSWITKGEKNRHYGKTKMNQRSSRSHTIFRMILESRERSDPASGENADGAIIVSHLNLVDLAGAERASQTGAEGARFKEGCNINRSLFTLGQVIKKLSDESQKGFLNYRDSKLTRILQNSLGGNAKTVIICTITPATVDETVSTLQFASAAKRMKNDPHVTEVSDEGALLRRYRNEIVDLKRRLQEVSSVTQTTATERESLCQILQEKDQLQREQEDRIKNLTKLLVTASNVALVPKVPKRRVTWGGKLLRSAHLVNEDLASTDMSFAEPYIKKRRADYSLPEEGEDMDEFDSRFDFTALDEPDMEMSTIAVRSSSEGSHFLDSPRASELMLKVSSLERQLEAETQSKQRAEEMSAELQLEISELQKKLEAQAAPSEEEKTVSELEALQSRLQTEVQERQKAEEKSSSLELKVAELEKPSEALLRCEMCEQLRKDLEETIQLCETVVFEKDAIIAERDLIKHSLQLVNEDLESLKAEKDSLQKDKDALQKDIDERKDADEFEKLEQESKREYERELESENSKLQQELKQSEDMIQKLQAELATISSELQKKTDLTTELQSFSDKNLVQEVTRLRRSLDDAECLSLETKREWAFLRSENISLKERDANLTTDHEKMEAEVKMIQDKLEQEKSRFKKMQTDLQKELMGAFDENTKLTAVLDGKVPKNLSDNLVLEKTVCDLRKELDQSHERERRLQSKMEEFETLSVKADELQRQVCGLSEELRSVGEERDALRSAQSSLSEAHQRLKEAQDQLLKMESDLVEAQLKEAELTQQLTETSERLQNLQTDLQRVTQESCTRLASLEEATQKSLQLSAELESVRAERDVLLSEKVREVQSDPDETENLRRTISSITEEREQLQEILQGLRDQLKRDMEENVEMMIETQAELRDAQEKVKELQGKLHRTESQRVQTVDQQKSCEDGQLDKLRDQIKQLTEELSAVVGEKRSDHCEQSDVTSLTEESGQLQERLQQLERDNIQMKTHLEEKHEMIQTLKEELETLLEQRNQLNLNLQETSQQVCGLSEELRSVGEERDALRSAQSSLSEAHQRLKEAQDQLLKMESDLVEAQLKEAELTQQLTETSERLQNLQTDLQRVTQESCTRLASLEEATQKSLQLSAELESVRAERDVLLSEKVREVQSDPDETENLRRTISSITEEREQLQEILQGLRDQRDQLKRDLEDTNGMLMQVQQERSGSHTVTQHDELLQQCILSQMQQLKEELDAVSQEKNQLKSDLQENVEMMIENQEELRGALEKVKNLQNTVQELESQRALMQSKDCMQSKIKQLREELENVCCERERLLSERSMNTLRDTEMMEQMKASISSLTEERDQLRQSLRDEVEQLRTEQQTMVQLRSELESVYAERDRVSSERTGDLQEMSAVTEERDQLLETLQRLTDESEQLKRDQMSSHDSQLVQVREQLQTACAERDRLLSEKSKSDLENTLLEEVQSSLASVTEEREQLLEILQVNREEKNQLRRDLEDKDETLLQLREELQSSSAEKERLLSERTEEQQEKLAEMKTAEASITALTRERDRLLETLQRVRDERDQLEKSEMMLQSVCAERDRLMTERDAACHQSSMTSLSKGGDLQEILQGVRELIQVQGELKQKKPTEKQKAQLEQIQALTEEMESLRNQRVVLRKELQEAAATSKMYQDLLHVTKEELKKQQKENAELMEQSAAKESPLQQQLSLMSEDLSALRDQRNTGIQNLQSNLRSLTKEKDELQDTLKRSREEGETLSLGLQKSEETRKQLTEELECLAGLKDQLENEKICAEKILESLRDATKESDQLKRELQGKMEKLAHTESKAEQLEKQKILLESEVHSLSQSLSEVNCSVSSDQSKHPSAHLIPGIETSAEKLQAAFATLQLIIDRPTNALAAINREEWAVIYQLLQIIPKNQRTVVVTHTKKTTRLNHVLIKIAEAYRRLAQRYKTRFETQLQRDVASFEESRLQDLLALTAPSQSFRALQDDFQQVWDLRLTCLLERWQQYLQTLEAGVRVLEEGLSKHAVMVSEEHQHRIRDLEELRSLLGSPQASAVLQLLQRQISRRSKATEHLNTFYFALLNRCESVRSPLISASAESEQQLEDQRRQTLTLLQAQHGTLPKTEAELLQDNQRVSLQLQQTQKQMEEIQEQMKELKVQADASNLQLQELSGQLKEKAALIQSLRDKLTESEVLARRSMTPEAADLAALKDKLVKMELDHIAVTTSQEKEVAQMTSVLEHRADVIRKLKETLRKMQQDDEQSFIDGDEFDLKLCSSTKEKKMEELQKKNARFESLVSKQQEEINKWKRRAYKMKESQRDAPCTPTKRLPPLTETELNSPKKTFLDSPKSKFFDMRSSVPVPLQHPPQFFDNSSLEAVPEDACAPAKSFLDSSDSDEEDSSSSAALNAAPIKDWWQIPNSSPAKPDASGNANSCPTQ